MGYRRGASGRWFVSTLGFVAGDVLAAAGTAMIVVAVVADDGAPPTADTLSSCVGPSGLDLRGRC